MATNRDFVTNFLLQHEYYPNTDRRFIDADDPGYPACKCGWEITGAAPGQNSNVTVWADHVAGELGTATGLY